jgi:uncharacterized protein (DUF302 family)
MKLLITGLLCALLLIAAALPAFATEEDDDMEESHGYYLSTMLDLPWDQAHEKVTAALKDQGFSVLTEIDMQAKFKEKLDKDIPPYLIMGACGAGFAYRAWEIDDHIGVMLPCNVVLHEEVDGQIEVMIRDPRGLSQFDPNLAAIAEEVYGKMVAVIAALEA